MNVDQSSSRLAISLWKAVGIFAALPVLFGALPAGAQPIGFQSGDAIHDTWLIVRGHEVDDDHTHHINSAPMFWEHDVTILEDAGFFNDSMTISGTLQHIFDPHHANAGPVYRYGVEVTADDFITEGDQVLTLAHSAAHADHWDWFGVRITVTNSIFGFFDDIDDFSVHVVGQHVFTEPPPGVPPPFDVPTPASSVVLSLGILFTVRRRR